MRSGARGGVALLSCVVAGLVAAAPAPAKGRKRPPPAPPRGWVVDRVRVESLTPGGPLSVGGRGEFRGVLEVVPAGGGLAVINEVGLDDYVRGVAEVPASWPLEAQRAQAIAARTYALHELGRVAPTAARAVGAHICATEACQVYVGLATERQEHGARWVEAVTSTSGQVLLHRGAPILAQYSSSNGGRSTPGGRPYLRAVNDPDDARSPLHRWEVRLGYGQLTTIFGLPGSLTSLRRTGDGVALDWTVPGGAAGQTVVAVADFRARLNEAMPPPGGLPRTVPSTQFAVLADDAAATAVLNGRGHGHGIGMSQFGALGKALRGQRAAGILASYYGGLRPTRVPADQLPPTVRVALDTASGGVAVGAPGRFRVLDGAGSPLAIAASGQWRVLPAGRGKVRVVPPGDQEGPPAVEVVGTEPAAPLAGDAVQVRYRLSAPAVVHLRVQGADGAAAVEVPPAVAEPGEGVVALPVAPDRGAYVATLAADAGGGRVATASLPVEVGAPAATAGPRAVVAGVGAAAQRRPVVTAAWLLLAVVAAALARSIRGGRRPRRS